MTSLKRRPKAKATRESNRRQTWTKTELFKELKRKRDPGAFIEDIEERKGSKKLFANISDIGEVEEIGRNGIQLRTMSSQITQ